MNLEPPILITDHLLLRIAIKDDIPKIIEYFTSNQYYLTPFYPRWDDNFFTEEYWQFQVEVNLHEFVNDRSLRLFIFLKNNYNRIIGTINFTNFVRGAAQYCNVGYSIAEAEQGKGYMTEALQAATKYVFTELKMHRITANYMPHNQRSGKLLKRLGFVVEGYARDFLLIDGQWQDHILTSLINSNW
ncbi:GNAT family N-acetyltransferase [Chlorogloeopsis sp. ULAP01]|uniref:GNAT family N-acetyltransferase n=1 Tax=Chlorogloeopsis sp. ULAP01 TaxID=3056483 RepID=UPI0025AAC94D|nr:GNAT family N-acetyltransferase [Chlorogloeopsis sp. ULAP01]MDM9382859.1 GNAT family N-acetyltransferase [Chlorogloeopsis sp. ULAP01]